MAAEETLIIKPKVKIKVFGVGGGGNSVLMRMGHHKELDIDLVAINTDAKQLARVAEEGVETLQIGEDLTKGRGTGGNIALGEKAALDAKDKIREAMNGADLVFVTAGLGGGTGTGAAPRSRTTSGRSRSASSRCRSASRAAARSAWPMRASRRCRPRWTR